MIIDSHLLNLDQGNCSAGHKSEAEGISASLAMGPSQVNTLDASRPPTTDAKATIGTLTMGVSEPSGLTCKSPINYILHVPDLTFAVYQSQ